MLVQHPLSHVDHVYTHQYAVEVLSLVKRALGVVSLVAQSSVSLSDTSPLYSDTKSMHYATVETEHPYKPACIKHFKVKFSDSIQWMTLEFDPRTGFAQPEDKIGELLIPVRRSPPSKLAQTNTPPTVTPLTGVSFDDLYNDWERFSLDSPPGLVLLPGVVVSHDLQLCVVTNFKQVALVILYASYC